MAFHVYSSQAMADFRLAYPREHIFVDGFIIGPLEEKKWFTLPRAYRRVHYDHDQDRTGRQAVQTDEDVVKELRMRYTHMGVVVADDEELAKPGAREALEAAAEAENKKFRAGHIHDYEQRMEGARANGKVLMPSKYEEECYELLGAPKPYSPEAIRAQRAPGAAAAEQIADVLSSAMRQAQLNNAKVMQEEAE